LRNRNEKTTTNKTVLQLLEEREKEIAEWSRSDAEKLLVQLEDAIAKICDNDLAKAAIQLISERPSHIPPFTPLRFVGNAAKQYKKDMASLTAEERREVKVFSEAGDEASARDYAIATDVVRDFYGSLTQLLTRIRPESDRLVRVGVWRILDSYHPDQRFRFYQVKPKPRRGR
jgi:hypothetical protein